jgi:hypothetical protein
MVPIFVPFPVIMGVEVVGAAGEVAGPVGAAVAALPVWAQAEITEKTAMARRERRNLLVIWIPKLLGT